MSNLIEALQTVGLSREESIVASLIIENLSIPFQLLLEKTNFDENKLRDILNKLIVNGIVAEIDGRYIPLPPIKLFIKNFFAKADKLRNIVRKVGSLDESELSTLLTKFREFDSKVRENLDVVQIELREKINSLLNDLAKFVDIVNSGKKSILDATNSFKSIIDKTKKSFEESLLNFRKIVESGEYSKIFKDLTDFSEIKKIYLPNVYTLKTIFEDLIQHLRSIDEIVKILERGIDELKRNLIGNIETLYNTLKNFSNEISANLVETLVNNIDSAFNMSLTQFDNLFSEASNKFSKIGEEIIKNFEEFEKDVVEGYRSVIDEVFNNIEDELKFYSNSLQKVLSGVEKFADTSLRKSISGIESVLKRSESIFSEEIKKIENLPKAFDRAINLVTDAVTKEFNEIFEKKINDLKKLEEDTWKSFLEKIADTANLIISTKDRAINSYRDLIDYVKQNVGILSEYILDLPKKLFDNLDREWRNFINNTSKIFKEFSEKVFEKVNEMKEVISTRFDSSIRSVLNALKNIDEGQMSVLKKHIESNKNSSIKELEVVLRKIDEILENEAVASNSDLENQLSEIKRLLGRFLEDRIKAFHDNLADHLEKTLKTRSAEANKLYENFHQTLRSSIENLSKLVSNTFIDVEKNYFQNLDILVDTMKIVFSNQFEALKELVNNVLMRVIEKVGKTAFDVEEILNRYTDQVINIFRESNIEIKERLDSFLRTFENELSKLPLEYKANISRVIENTKGGLEMVSLNTTKALKDSYNKVEEETKKIGEIIEKCREILVDEVRSRNEEIDKLISDIMEKNRIFSQEGGEIISNYVKKIFEDVKNFAKREFSTMDKKLENVLDELKNLISSKVNESKSSIRDKILKDFNQNVSSLNDYINSIKELVDKISEYGKIIDKLDKENYVSRIEEVKRYLSEFDKNLDSFFRDSIYKIEEYYKDKFVSRILENVNNIMGSLEDSLSRLDKVGSVELEKLVTELEKGSIERILSHGYSLKQDFEKFLDRFKAIEKLYTVFRKDIESILVEEISRKFESLKTILEDLFVYTNKSYLFLSSYQDKYFESFKRLLKSFTVIRGKDDAEKMLFYMLKKARSSIVAYINDVSEVFLNKLYETLSIINIRCVLKTPKRFYRVLTVKGFDKIAMLSEHGYDIPNVFIAIIDGLYLLVYDQKYLGGTMYIVEEAFFTNILKHVLAQR